MWRLDGIWHRVATWHRNEIELMINLILFSTWTHFTNFWTLWFTSKITKLWIEDFRWIGSELRQAAIENMVSNWFPSETPPFPLSGSPVWSDTGRASKQRVSFYRSTTIIFFRKDSKSMHINQNYELDLNIKC